MLRFAVVASVLGLTAAIFFVAANEISAIETPQILWALCAGVFVAFIPAVLGHPKASYEGTTVSVDPRQTIRSAPWWSTVLVGLAMLATLSLSLALPESEFGFGSRADLVGRPDRFRFVAVFTSVFYAASLHIALSGLKLQKNLLDYLQSP